MTISSEPSSSCSHPPRVPRRRSTRGPSTWPRPRSRSASATSGSPSTTSRPTAICRARRSSRPSSQPRPRGCRVGTAVIVVPLHHPLVVAEEIATLDHPGRRAGGHRARARLPALRVRAARASSWTPPARAGRNRSTSSSRRSAAQPFTYDGKLFKIPETSVFPQPLQKPHPPIWVTAQSPESVEAAVRRGFQRAHGRLRRSHRAHGGVPEALRPRGGGVTPAAHAGGRRAARGLRDRQRGRRARRRRGGPRGTCG
mgnify:CR=1 FL=1